jgi:hypothetical protein
MKKTLLMVLLVLVVTGCMESSPATSDQITQRKQEKSMREAEAQAGLPAIRNYQEKKLLKMLYELRDQEGLVCHAYLFNEYKGTVGQYLGKCIGYGLPASTQYSNPSKFFDDPHGYRESGSLVMPQAEPNGLFMPQSSSATWLMMIDPKGDTRPVYVEPTIIVSPFKL